MVTLRDQNSYHSTGVNFKTYVIDKVLHEEGTLSTLTLDLRLSSFYK